MLRSSAFPVVLRNSVSRKSISGVHGGLASAAVSRSPSCQRLADEGQMTAMESDAHTAKQYPVRLVMGRPDEARTADLIVDDDVRLASMVFRKPVVDSWQTMT